MAQVTKEISVDVSKQNVFQAIVAKQNDDNSRFLKVTLTDNGKKIEVSASTVILNGFREDEKASSFLGTVNDDGTVTVPLTNWLLALDGKVKCDITIIDTEKRKLTSTSFTLDVEAAANPNEDVSEDENYDLLIQLLNTYTETKVAAEQAIANANNAAKNAEETTTSISEEFGWLKNLVGTYTKKNLVSGITSEIKVSLMYSIADEYALFVEGKELSNA